MEVENQPPISNLEPDWGREELEYWWQPGKQLIKAIRQYQKLDKSSCFVSSILKRIYVIPYRFWSVVSSADIPINCQIGGGLKLTHPNGVVIHPQASIGPNCLILQQVTIVAGVKVGAQVDIGAGAKIIHPVTIGDRAKIGANAVVLCDVPPGATAVGIPAKIIIKNNETSDCHS